MNACQNDLPTLSRDQREQLLWATLAHLADGPDLFLWALVQASSPAHVLARLSSVADLVKAVSDRHARLQLVVGNGLADEIVQALKSAGIEPAHSCHHSSAVQFLSAHILLWTKRLETIRQMASASPHTANKQPSQQSVPARLWNLYTHNGMYHLCHPGDAYWPADRFADLIPVQQADGENGQNCEGCAPPLCLWVEGDPNTLGCPSLAIVGSRQASTYGLTITGRCARTAAGAGYAIITGGAMGVDGQANRSASGLGFPTLAVFAGGLDKTGPACNLPLFDQIVKTGGALVSEVPPWVVPRSYRFLERNRLIAALCDTVLVTQARYRSGALSTARWARSLHRPVIVVPGPITDTASGGCNAQLCLPPDSRPLVLTRVEDLPQLVEQSSSTALRKRIIAHRAQEHPLVFGACHTDRMIQTALLPDDGHTSPSHKHCRENLGKKDPSPISSPTAKMATINTKSANMRTANTDSLTEEILDRLRSHRLDTAQVFSDLAPHRPGLTVSRVAVCLARLEAKNLITIDEAGRACLKGSN